MDIIRDILTGTLTKDHFNYIVHQMKMYQIDVKECARFIFENAIFYHRAAPYYAKVCKEFGSLSYSVTEAKEQNVFLFYLFCFCKEEYNNHVGIAKVYIAHERRKKKIMKNKNSVNKHLLPVMDKGLSDLQHRANGLGNFIGELLKLGLIPNQTFWHFINVLMSPIANCEFCIDFVCHFLLSADGKFKSKIDIQKLRNIMDYFEHQIKSNQHKYDSRAWPAVRKVLGMKKHWIPPLRMKTVSLKHVVNQTKASEIPLDENVYEIIKGTTIENIDQIAEQLNNDISISPLCLHGTVDFLIEKGIKNSLPDNIFAHLCAKINILASQNLNESFKDRLIACCQKEFEYQVCNRLDDSIRGHEKRKKRLMGTVQFMGALFNVNLLCDNIILRCLKYLLDPATISEDSIECLSHFMTTIGGIGGKEKKFKQTILQLRAVIKELETKYSVEIQDSLWNLLESLKTLDKSENTSFLGQTSSVKFKKK